MKALLCFLVFHSTILRAEIISSPMITGTIHKITNERVIIRIPSGEKTMEYRVHIDRKWLPTKYKELRLNQTVSFVRTKEMVKRNAILQLKWRVQ